MLRRIHPRPSQEVREEMMKQVVLGSANFRQRFVLELVRHPAEAGAVFEIAKCHAVGWILDGLPVEELWEAEAKAAAAK